MEAWVQTSGQTESETLFHSTFILKMVKDATSTAGYLMAPPPHKVLISLLQGAESKSSNHSSGFAAVQAAKEKAQLMDAAFQKAESELEFLHGEVYRKASGLKALFSQHEASYEREVQAAWAGSSVLRDSLREVESRMNRISQVGTRIGDRLQVREV